MSDTKPTKVDKVNKIILDFMFVLDELTGGQGSATATIWDAGAGGGFSFGELDISLERDGESLKKKVYTLTEFRALVEYALCHPLSNKIDENVANAILESKKRFIRDMKDENK